MTKSTGLGAYHLLKSALALYGKTPAALNEDELAQARHQAGQTLDLETRMLASREAFGLTVPESRLNDSLAEIRARYADEFDFLRDLAANDLSLDSLKMALRRDLWCELALERVAADAAPVTQDDLLKAYEVNRERLIEPETRDLRHILVTINPDFADNTPQRARARLAEIAAALGARPTVAAFADAATRHSECPSALDGGKLGRLPAGTLFPALDAFAFRAAPGAMSGVIETEAGLHLVFIEAVHPGGLVPFEDAAPKLHAAIAERRAKARQRDWLKALKATAPQATRLTPDKEKKHA